MATPEPGNSGFVSRADYERDVVRLGQHAAELRSALLAALITIDRAKHLLTPGMRAGTAEACEVLGAGSENARAALLTATVDADAG